MALFRQSSGPSLVPSTLLIGDRTVETTQRAEDVASQREMDLRVTRWCVFNRFLIQDAAGQGLVANIAGTDMSLRLPRYLYAMNLKQLCKEDFFAETLAFLQDTDFEHPISRLIDLHVQLLTELDARFLNIYHGKLIHALNTIYPHETPELPWVSIFAQYPYLWVLFPIQRIMRDATPMK